MESTLGEVYVRLSQGGKEQRSKNPQPQGMGTCQLRNGSSIEEISSIRIFAAKGLFFPQRSAIGCKSASLDVREGVAIADSMRRAPVCGYLSPPQVHDAAALMAVIAPDSSISAMYISGIFAAAVIASPLARLSYPSARSSTM